MANFFADPAYMMDDTQNAQQQHQDSKDSPKLLESSNLVRHDHQQQQHQQQQQQHQQQQQQQQQQHHYHHHQLAAKSIQFHSKVMDVLVAYGACKKNQNHTSATPVHDGCMEFSSNFKGERTCDACGCHRSFHERIILMRDQNGNISCASQMVLPEMAGRKEADHPYLTSGAAATNMLNVNSPGGNAAGNKRRKMDDFCSDDSGYTDLIRSASPPSSGAIILNPSQQPLPLQSLEVIDGEIRSSSGWLCEADREKLLGASYKKMHHHGDLSPGGFNTSPGAPPEKLASFFERLQKEHPESPLKLEFVDGSWRVLCGVCARYLRADKKGETLHNIQKQHFVTPKHLSNLKAKLEAPDEMEFWLKRMAKLRDKRAQQRAQPRFITAG